MESTTKLYEVIINYLEKQIADGAYNGNVRLPTEIALAKMFSVSRITARRALSELERKGLIYRRQGSGSYAYQNTKVLKDMTNSSETFDIGSNTVSLILPYDSLGGRFSEIVRGAAEVLENYGYHLILHNSRTNMKIEREIILSLMKTGVRGIIYYPHKDMSNIDLLYEIWMRKIPFVTIDKKIPEIPVCGVYSDNFKGSYELTRKLIENGHTKISCFYYLDLADVFTIRQRFFGYCAALHDSNIPVELKYVVNYYDGIAGKSSRESVIGELLNTGVTAVVAENDYTALDIIEICSRMKINIPNQLSVIGFDNIPQSEYTKPPLTTAEQDFATIGKLAAEAVIAQIECKAYETDQVVPVKIINRKSIKKLN